MKTNYIFFVKVSIALFFVICMSNNVTAQLTKNEANKSHVLRYYFGTGKVKDNSIDYLPAQKLGYFGLNIDYTFSDFESNGKQIAISSPFIYDLLQSVLAGWKSSSVPHFTSFFNGKFGKNIMNGSSFSLAAGVSLSDYFLLVPNLGSNGEEINSGHQLGEPSGWHLTAGPAIFFNAGNEKIHFSLNACFDLTYATGKTGSRNEQHIFHEASYSKPFFMQINPRITIKNFYIGYDYLKLIDRGGYSHATKRSAIMFGSRIILGA